MIDKFLNRIFITEYNQELISNFRNNMFVIKTDEFLKIPEIYDYIINSQNSLHCIIASDITRPLSFIPFTEEWKNIPISIYAGSFGHYSTFDDLINLIRDLNIRIFLPASNEENITGLKILSSLGINCGFFFGKEKTDWLSLFELLKYRVNNKTKHASLEPIDYIISNYNPSDFSDYNTVYFNNPKKYLYLSHEFKVALDEKECELNNFICDTNNCCEIENLPEYKRYFKRWQQSFLNNDFVTRLPYWRLIQLNFSEKDYINPGFNDFFNLLLESAENNFFNKEEEQKNKVELWQL